MERLRAIWLELKGKKHVFHQRAIVRMKNNMVTGLLISKRWWYSDPKVMGDMGVKYFQDMITTFEPHMVETNIAVVKRVVTREMNSKLQHPFTTEEVKQAVFQMHPQKP